MSLAPVAADFLWSYHCNGKGCCCKAGWRIGLVERDVDVLTSTSAGTPHGHRVREVLESARRSPFHDVLPSTGPKARRPEVGEIPKDDAGSCTFVAPDGLCELHRDLGEGALPRVCQSFPVLAGYDGAETGTAWELLCPEVARTLAEAQAPARIVPAPAGLRRDFVADAWLAPPVEVPVAEGAETLASRSEAAAFRGDLARRLADAPDRPFAILGEALGDLLQWAATGVPPRIDEAAQTARQEAAQTARQEASTGLLAMAEAARRRFVLLADDRDRVLRTVRLARGFFVHHPWGTAATLDPIAKAFGAPLGPLAAIDASTTGGGDFALDERLVFANWAIARQGLPTEGEPSLLAGLARTAVVLVDALFFRFLCEAPGGAASGVEKATAALALADAHHRGRDAGAVRFAELLWYLGRSRTVAKAAATLGEDALRRPIGAVLLTELAHQRAHARARAGWLGRLTADWRMRFEAHGADPGTRADTGTPGLPLTTDAPEALQADPDRGAAALAGLALAVATDGALRRLPASEAPLAGLFPELGPAALERALARLEGRGLLVGSPTDGRPETPRNLATRVSPALVADALDRAAERG